MHARYVTKLLSEDYWMWLSDGGNILSIGIMVQKKKKSLTDELLHPGGGGHLRLWSHSFNATPDKLSQERYVVGWMFECVNAWMPVHTKHYYFPCLEIDIPSLPCTRSHTSSAFASAHLIWHLSGTFMRTFDVIIKMSYASVIIRPPCHCLHTWAAPPCWTLELTNLIPHFTWSWPFACRCGRQSVVPAVIVGGRHLAVGSRSSVPLHSIGPVRLPGPLLRLSGAPHSTAPGPTRLSPGAPQPPGTSVRPELFYPRRRPLGDYRRGQNDRDRRVRPQRMTALRQHPSKYADKLAETRKGKLQLI